MPLLADPEFLFRSLLGTYGCDLFLDIGSRDGGSSLEAAGSVENARFVLFEAAPENIARMRADPRLDRADFTLEHLAVAARDGALTFYIYRDPGEPENRGLSSTKRRRNLEPSEVVEVRAVALDSWMTAHPEFGSMETIAMWIDVEGAAFEVLEGATEALARTRMVFVELEEEVLFDGGHTRSEVRELMSARGFRELAWGPHRGGRKGDSLFVREDFLAAPGVGEKIEEWGAHLQREARRRRIYEVVRRIPPLHALWRWVRGGR